MAVTISRVRQAETVRRSGASFDPDIAAERQKAMHDLFDELGIRQIKFCRSLDYRVVRIQEGAPGQAMMPQQVLSSTGAYDSLEAEILEDVDDVLARSDQVQRLAKSFRPPNQDEIDRMLLEE